MKHTIDPLARSTGGQCDLFGNALSDRPASRARPVYRGEPPAQNSDTSRAAAAKQHAKAPTIRMNILALVRGRPGGVTGEEAGEHLAGCRGLPADNTACRLSAGARLTELRLGGFVRDSGRRRPTRSGCTSIVFVATAKEGDGRVCETTRGGQ